MLGRPKHGHAFGFQTELFTILRAIGNRHTGFFAIYRRHFNFAAERGSSHGDGHFAIKVSTIALEKFMGAHRDKNIKITCRSAAHPSLTFAAQTNAGAVFNA